MTTIWQKKIFLPLAIFFGAAILLLNGNSKESFDCAATANDPSVIILVTSNAPNIRLRQAQRRAYSNDFLWSEFRAIRLFMVAQVNNTAIQKHHSLG